MQRVRLVNGAVWTARSGRPWAVALEITDGRVSAVFDEPPAPRPDDVDLRGAAVLPGLVDAHVHFLPWARRLGGLDLRAARDLPQLQSMLAARASQLPPGEWLLASGFHPACLGGLRPHRAHLDAACPGRPVYVSTHDTHAGWAGSEALRLAGISAATPDPPDGALERDASGLPTGFLFEAARELVTRHIPGPTPEQELEILARGQREAHRLGVTAVHSFEGAPESEVLRRAREAGRLTLRVTRMFPRPELDAQLEAGARTGAGDQRLRVGCLKLFADGTLGLRTACMLAPYASGGTGEWAVPPAELRELAVKAAAAGLGVAIHAIGDLGVRAALDALEAARLRGPVPLRVEHAQVVAPPDVPRFAAARIAASMQPVHFLTDRALAQAEWGGRCGLAYAWGPLSASGAELLFGTDAPVEALDPWATLAAAVRPGGAESPAHHPGRAVSLAAALDAMTRAPRRVMDPGAAGPGPVCGELRPGAVADLVVLDRGARELERGLDLESVVPALTLVDGGATHAVGPFAGFPGTSGGQGPGPG